MDFVPHEVIMELSQQIAPQQQSQQVQQQEGRKLTVLRYQTGMALRTFTNMVRNPMDVKLNDAFGLGWLWMVLSFRWVVELAGALTPERAWS